MERASSKVHCHVVNNYGSSLSSPSSQRICFVALRKKVESKLEKSKDAVDVIARQVVKHSFPGKLARRLPEVGRGHALLQG